MTILAHGTIRKLAEERFVSGQCAEVLGVDLTREPQWAAFQDIFNHLQQDQYMSDGGTYRQRRFGRFTFDANRDDLELQPHGPYTQPKYFNPLNGGLERHFAPLTANIVANPVFQRILQLLGRGYSAVEDVSSWKINTYFNRIIARSDEIGKPVPEGMHRDGVKFSCLFMAQRASCNGGETSLIDLITHQPVFKGTLDQPAKCILFRDDTVLHDTTPIAPVTKRKIGYRDVLVVEFY